MFPLWAAFVAVCCGWSISVSVALFYACCACGHITNKHCLHTRTHARTHTLWMPSKINKVHAKLNTRHFIDTRAEGQTKMGWSMRQTCFHCSHTHTHTYTNTSTHTPTHTPRATPTATHWRLHTCSKQRSLSSCSRLLSQLVPFKLNALPAAILWSATPQHRPSSRSSWSFK